MNARPRKKSRLKSFLPGACLPSIGFPAPIAQPDRRGPPKAEVAGSTPARALTRSSENRLRNSGRPFRELAGSIQIPRPDRTGTIVSQARTRCPARASDSCDVGNPGGGSCRLTRSHFRTLLLTDVRASAGRATGSTPGECIPVSVSDARRFSKPQGRVRSPGGGLVEIREQIGFRPRSVPEPHTTLRRSETRFDSWRGHLRPTDHAPQARGFVDRAAVESRRWSQTARPPVATRLKWVRLPPASPCILFRAGTGPPAQLARVPCVAGRCTGRVR